jgi:hypothetical protein
MCVDETKEEEGKDQNIQNFKPNKKLQSVLFED